MHSTICKAIVPLALARHPVVEVVEGVGGRGAETVAIGVKRFKANTPTSPGKLAMKQLTYRYVEVLQ